MRLRLQKYKADGFKTRVLGQLCEEYRVSVPFSEGHRHLPDTKGVKSERRALSGEEETSKALPGDICTGPWEMGRVLTDEWEQGEVMSKGTG